MCATITKGRCVIDIKADWAILVEYYHILVFFGSGLDCEDVVFFGSLLCFDPVFSGLFAGSHFSGFQGGSVFLIPDYIPQLFTMQYYGIGIFHFLLYFQSLNFDYFVFCF